MKLTLSHITYTKAQMSQAYYQALTCGTTVPKRCISRYFSVDGFIPVEASFDPTLCKE